MGLGFGLLFFFLFWKFEWAKERANASPQLGWERENIFSGQGCAFLKKEKRDRQGKRLFPPREEVSSCIIIVDRVYVIRFVYYVRAARVGWCWGGVFFE